MKQINEDQTYLADLHIHTPSSKCYKGPKTDESYLDILNTAKKKGLSIIAITDHNSIKGYEKLMQIKSDLFSKENVIKDINDSKQAKKQLQETRKKLKLFDDILILPGVEFEVNNCIHMLIVFNPNTSIETIKKMLEEGGYDDEMAGSETPEELSKWDICALLEQVKKYDCLLIDAHTDSDKGVFNTIPQGKLRAKVLSSSNLNGICYNSERQKQNIKNLFIQAIEYKREKEIAFLKFSDSHEPQTVGKSYSYFKLNSLNWDELKLAFDNPAEKIFTQQPNTIRVLTNILKNNNRLSLSEHNCEKVEHEMLRSFCSLMNSDGGYIVWGAQDENIIEGIPEFEDLETYINGFQEKISGYINYSISKYKLQNGNIVVVLKVDKSENLVGIIGNDIVFFYKNKGIVQLPPYEVQKLVESRFYNQILPDLESQLIKIETSTSIVRTHMYSIPIMDSYYTKSEMLLSHVVFQYVIPEQLSEDDARKISDSGKENGLARGTGIFFRSFSKPRYSDAYVRLSAPLFNLKTKIVDDKKPGLYLLPGGAIYYSKKKLCQYNKNNLPIIEIRLKENDDYPLLFLCAFLKSSYFFWWMINQFGHNDLSRIEPEKVFIPKINLKNTKVKNIITSINSSCNEILSLEKKFLSTKFTEDIFCDEVEKHNNATKEHFLNINSKIYDLLNISEENQKTIEENLKMHNIYL